MRWMFAFLLALLSLSDRGIAQPDHAPLVVYNPHGSKDMMNMWTDDAPWQEAAKKVQVLVLVHFWVVRTPLEQVRQVVEYAKRHNMKISLSVEGIAKFHNENCGLAEGYTFHGELTNVVKVLKRLDVDLDHVEIDEPLWFGAYSTAAVDCHLPVKEVIRRTAMNLREVLDVYPNAIITQIEPIPAVTNVPTWREDLATFQLGMAQELGKPIRLVQLDINWPDRRWRQGLLDMQAWLRQRNLAMGIIYNGSPIPTSDQGWIDSAIDNVETIEGAMKIIPEFVSFQTWGEHPACNLPESGPATLTWWINRYFRPRTILNAQFVGRGVQGKLTTTDGKPIGNATIKGFKPGVDFLRPLPVSVMRGVVPPNAAAALIAVRVNTECDGCDGLNDLLVGAMQYQETQGGSAQKTYSVPNNSRIANGVTFGSEKVGGITVTRIIAPSGKSTMFNSDAFPVTAGAKFALVIPAATIGGLGWNGNVNLIWIDGNGNGLNRVKIIPDTGKALMSTAVTAEDGTFALAKLPRSVEGPNAVTVEFDGGGGAWRTSVWTPLR